MTAMASPRQSELFDASAALPEGFIYREGFLGLAEESALLREIAALPLREASYKQWTAKRRTISFGGQYDFTRNQLDPAEPVPAFLHPLRQRISEWTAIPAAEFAHAMIAEYQPGTQLGWHRDVPQFEVVVGVSLAATARMRFRAYPPRKGQGRATSFIDLPPRSGYWMSGVARWKWQHAISPTKALRYSVTFRTLSRVASR
jgi:alkylated DNA repair dioxygenase AlkB